MLCALAENHSQSMYYVWKSIFFHSTKGKKYYRKANSSSSISIVLEFSALPTACSMLNKFLRIYCLCIHRWACYRRTIPFSVTHSLTHSLILTIFFSPSFSKTDLIVTRISNKLVTRNVAPHHMQTFKLIVETQKKEERGDGMRCCDECNFDGIDVNWFDYW